MHITMRAAPRIATVAVDLMGGQLLAGGAANAPTRCNTLPRNPRVKIKMPVTAKTFADRSINEINIVARSSLSVLGLKLFFNSLKLRTNVAAKKCGLHDQVLAQIELAD